ncbi:MAG: DUF1848 domain-containing protein [Alphaproteobacteria bacterium]|nr:DUF1848 domain-containing protein [Alphaproteobacteria bacterium]
MIVSASYRTDIPAFYGQWFMNRLAAGWCDVANPYGGAPYRVSLRRQDVDGLVFWTKNLGDFADHLDSLRAHGYPFVVHYSINGYPRALETSVTDAQRSVAHMRHLRDRFGPRVAVWRYDPVIDTDLTPLDWHRENFARLAVATRGLTDEAVVSFAHIYRKTRRNLSAAARRAGFAWRDPAPEEKRALAARLVEIAADSGMRLTVCSQPAVLVPGAEPARCIDAVRLADLAGAPVPGRLKGNRPGCGCYESRDIGAYDTCPHGCVYCYAVQNRALAQRRFRQHDPDAEYLIAPASALADASTP